MPEACAVGEKGRERFERGTRRLSSARLSEASGGTGSELASRSLYRAIAAETTRAVRWRVEVARGRRRRLTVSAA